MRLRVRRAGGVIGWLRESRGGYRWAREARGHGVPEVTIAVADNGGRFRPQACSTRWPEPGLMSARRSWPPSMTCAPRSPICSPGLSVLGAVRTDIGSAEFMAVLSGILLALRPGPATDQALVLSVFRDGLRPQEWPQKALSPVRALLDQIMRIPRRECVCRR